MPVGNAPNPPAAEPDRCTHDYAYSLLFAALEHAADASRNSAVLDAAHVNLRVIRSILGVCVGNICRSPLAEPYLPKALPRCRISSAGLAALQGYPADAAKAAAEIGLSLARHSARQFTEEIGKSHDLILVMKSGHRSELTRRFPQFSVTVQGMS